LALLLSSLDCAEASDGGWGQLLLGLGRGGLGAVQLRGQLGQRLVLLGGAVVFARVLLLEQNKQILSYCNDPVSPDSSSQKHKNKYQPVIFLKIK